MLQFNDVQWQSLLQAETDQFIMSVCEEFLAQRPEMLAKPGWDSVLANMRAAYGYALRLGFTSTPHIVRLMYLSADAPGIHDDQLVNIYLRKRGATPEQRLDELDAVMANQLRGTH